MTDLAAAMSLHQAGRLAEAENAYRAILSREPFQIDATHLLGILARQSGRPESAVLLMLRAVELNDRVPEFHYNLATALIDLGRLNEAAEACRRALTLRPGYFDAALGLANVLARLGDDAGAAEAYREVLALAPSRADAACNLGVVLRRMGKVEDAVASYRRAISIDPNGADTHYNLGNALAELGRPGEAIESFLTAIALRPSHPESHYNLANAQSTQGDFASAEASYRRALAVRPDYVEAHNNLGKMLQSLGRNDEALACFDAAVRLAPENGDVRYNRALTLLLLGRCAEGWAEHEWRWRSKSFPSPKRAFSQPLWDGRERPQSTLLVHAEQGFGDTFQFARYIASARRRVGRVVFEAPRALSRVLRTVEGIDELVATGDPLPSFDVHVPLLTLVLLLGESAASGDPYVAAERELLDAWRGRLAGNDRLKVGIVWAGNPNHSNDRNRSLPVDMLRALVQMPAADVYSLQLGPRRADLTMAGVCPHTVDLAGQIADFADTAAALCGLDLLVTVDTAVAHLAGALGRPVWVMLPFAPDWRWELKRPDTRWYPSMRLFRQPRRGDWTSPIREILDQVSRSRSAG